MTDERVDAYLKLIRGEKLSILDIMNMDALDRWEALSLARNVDMVDVDVPYLLYIVCDNVHASCDESCPVFSLMTEDERSTLSSNGCPCFKDGKKMMNFIVNSTGDKK